MYLGPPLLSEADIREGTVVRHYKGNQYVIIGVAQHTETAEIMVVYRSVGGWDQVWVRPYRMFFDLVDGPNGPEPRFSWVSDGAESE